ncbi:MAG: diaminohydroxyphosphoribosylaminopyrimidine deaminase [Pelagibacterales bacterium]|nr:diaminohydroxyphosphoribosylaminopyrimidine deaminase [Pelagibacterales bacterium]
MSTKKIKKNKQSFFMQLALMNANRNIGSTNENPSVGCVVVKNNCVISSSCTNVGGRPHAEYIALNNSKKTTKSDLYVTLEPCSHYGKTSPCVNEIIKKKIKNVYYSVSDPDKRSFNKCKEILKRENIKVNRGLLHSEVKDFYQSYFNYQNNKLPFVTAKLAVSKDFFSAKRNNKWITNKYSRSRVHLIRSKHDCILSSSKTVLIDNSNLTCRINGLENKSPVRIILDKNLNIRFDSNIIKSTNKYSLIIFYNKNNISKLKKLKKLKIKLFKLDLNKEKQFDLHMVLKKIKSLGFSRILLESGLNLMTLFLKKKLVNNFELFISNKIVGSAGHNNFKDTMNTYLKGKVNKLNRVNLFGDKFLSYKIK